MWLSSFYLVGFWISMVSSTGPRSAFVQRLEPLDFQDTEYFMTSSDHRSRNGISGTGPAMMEDLRRGQEGLMIKLNDVTRSLKEDELKLNNIFYKLGRHDTDLESVDRTLNHLSTSSKRIESKLNKHAFNVDFLRRKVDELRSNVEAEERMEVQLTAAKSLINRLEDRLTDALARLGTVENATQTLEKRSVPHFDDLHVSTLALHSRPPTLAVYPERHEGQCKVTWEQVGTGCYWFGSEELTFSEAIASCTQHGGHLLTLSPPGNQLNLLTQRLQPDTVYWTCGTDAFNQGNWEFLMTATPVMPLHWALDINSTAGSQNSHRCAALTNHGVVKRRCIHRLPYICHIL